MNARAGSTSRLVLSVDLDEWYHSRRWLDGEQAVCVPDMRSFCRRMYGQDRPAGDVIAPTRRLLALFAHHGVRATFFVLGEMAEWYPALIEEIAAGNHEIACHGMHHVDMTVLGPERFTAQLRQARETLIRVAGVAPRGYRAPNLVYEPWATQILESEGFECDSSVCVSRSIGGKYKGWSHAPVHPYRPAYDNVATPGAAQLIELPLPTFPLIRLSAGSGIVTRFFGYRWSAIALAHTLRTGDSGYYFHPWEVGPRPPAAGSRVRSALFLRRTGPWMLNAVDRLLRQFEGRVMTASEAVHRFRASEAWHTAAATPRLITGA